MKLNIALLLAYVSLCISIAQAGRYDRNRKMGIRSASFTLDKFVRDADDPNKG